MRKLFICAGLAALLSPLAATEASARPYGYGGGPGYGYGGPVQHERRECRRELRHADSRREYHRELRECHREIARARRHEWRDHRYERGYDGWRGDRGGYGYGERRGW